MPGLSVVAVTGDRPLRKHLGLVDSTPFDPPYPADTRSAGWRFQLDTQRLRASDTWALASPEVRPWLLMLWVVSWDEIPSGSLPALDDVMAAKIGMTPASFQVHRPILMRGWRLASDNRFYHDVISDLVLDRLTWKANERERKASYRTRMSHGTDEVSHGKADTGADSGADSGALGKTKTNTRAPDGALFDRFWLAYPKKRSKGQAEKVWIKLGPGEELLGVILKAIERAKGSREWLSDEGRFIPHPASWLNAKAWEDVVDRDDLSRHGEVL